MKERERSREREAEREREREIEGYKVNIRLLTKHYESCFTALKLEFVQTKYT